LRGQREERSGVSHNRGGASMTTRPTAPLPELPRVRAPVLFGVLALLFAILVGRTFYLQWLDNDFLQERGAARFSREIELAAHRGQIVDRFGEALAISTPVKSLWSFPGQFEATPSALASLARLIETTPQRLSARVSAADDFIFVARQIAPETAVRAMALKIKGLNEQTEYRRYYPAGEVTAQVIGF